jgi:cyanate permease
VKWGALFAAHALTAGLLLRRDGLTRWLGVVPALTAAAGLAGLLLPAERRLVELAGVSGTAATWTVVLALAVAAIARRR